MLRGFRLHTFFELFSSSSSDHFLLPAAAVTNIKIYSRIKTFKHETHVRQS